MESYLRNIKIISTDVDGTLTDRRRRLSITAIKAVRRLEEIGIPIMLISSQSFPVLCGLADYIGTSAPVIAESGGVIGKSWEILYKAEKNFDEKLLTRIMEKMGFIPKRHNVYRHVDFAFSRSEKSKKILEDEIKRVLAENGITEVNVYDSGFAVHVTPKGVDKGTGLLRALKLLGISIDNVLVIGDGKNDVPMFKVAKISLAPKNAAEEVKKLATVVSEKEDGDVLEEVVGFFSSKF